MQALADDLRLLLQIAVDQVDCEEECLGFHPELHLHLDDPIDEDASHLGVDVRLLVDVALRRDRLQLVFLHVLEDIAGVLSHVAALVHVESIAELGVLQAHLVHSLVPELLDAQALFRRPIFFLGLRGRL